MAKTSVLVLCNQPTLPADHPDAYSEHSVVEVAEKIVATLREEAYDVTELRLGADPTTLWHELTTRKPDVCVNLYEGQLENTDTESYVAGLLDWAGVSYTGSPYATLTLARAKHMAKYLLKGARLPTADFFVIQRLPAPPCPLKFPVIVKPAQQDASVGMAQASVCENPAQLEERARFILATYGAPVLVEQYISGREFNVAVIELPDLMTLPPVEITFPAESPGNWSILTYSGKWTAGSPEYERTPVKCPTDLPPAMLRKLDRLARQTFRVLGCRDYARVDFRLNAAGKPFILEVNPNPEISESAGFTGRPELVHIPYREFLTRLVQQALARKNAAKPTFALVPSIH